jgi:hypothetical protein
MKSDPVYGIVADFFASPAYSRALLTKFSAPRPNGFLPIPADKHRHFENGATDYTSVFDFQVDLPGYEIPPHPDVSDKIVTFQYFLVDDDSVADFGTLFCKAKNGGGKVKRPLFYRGVGRIINRGSDLLRVRRTRLFKRLEQSRLGLAFGVGTTNNWLPWSLVDVVKIAKALPNHFMAFAPNEISYHAVQMNIPTDCKRQERPVIRGFLRKGRDANNWISAVKM